MVGLPRLGKVWYCCLAQEGCASHQLEPFHGLPMLACPGSTSEGQAQARDAPSGRDIDVQTSYHHRDADFRRFCRESALTMAIVAAQLGLCRMRLSLPVVPPPRKDIVLLKTVEHSVGGLEYGMLTLLRDIGDDTTSKQWPLSLAKPS